jgi:hypothetical protein
MYFGFLPGLSFAEDARNPSEKYGRNFLANNYKYVFVFFRKLSTSN